jgi:hypothetical protein
MPIGNPTDDDLLRTRTVLFEALLDALPISDACSWRLVDALDAFVRVRVKKEPADA